MWLLVNDSLQAKSNLPFSRETVSFIHQIMDKRKYPRHPIQIIMERRGYQESVISSLPDNKFYLNKTIIQETNMDQTLKFSDIGHFSTQFDAEPENQLSMNAVTKNGVQDVALNREVFCQTNHTFSNLIQTPKATNQLHSGRCWLFAGLNTLRLEAMKELNLEQFELSQSYLMFWDKLEKANFFLENIIETRNEPLDGRLVMWLLDYPLPDGGQWDMFVSLIKKYGVVPKSVMPESHSSSNSKTMNAIIAAKLREYAQILRELHQEGAELEDLRGEKEEMLEEIYRMLAIHLGKPPALFMWEWRDKDNAFHRRGALTPLQFFNEYIKMDLREQICLINAPTADKPFNKTYTVQYLGNVAGGQPIQYLNVDLQTLKKAAVDMIVDGHAVWFGCDVGKWFAKEPGILDPQIYDFELVYGMNFAQDKAGRLNYGQSRMTHAMVLTGVDLDDSGNPLKWRVENSWGPEEGDKGYLVMSDDWFDQYLYEITVRKDYLSPELLSALEAAPVKLPPWDPMGALAIAS